MRVDILTKPSSPNGETAAKTAESGNGFEGAFFAEIDHALNREELEAVQGQGKESEQRSDLSELGDLNLFFGACLFSMQPAAAQANIKIGLPDSPPSASPPEEESAIASDGKETTEGMKAGFGERNSEKATPAAPDLNPAASLEIQNMDSPQKSLPSQSPVGREGMPTAVLESGGLAEKIDMDDAIPTGPETVHPRFQQDLTKHASTTEAAIQESAPRSEVAPVADPVISDDKKPSILESKTSWNENPWTGLSNKSNPVSKESDAEADMSQSSSDRASARNEFPAGISPQSKMESSDSNKAKTLSSEHLQEKQTAVSSGYERSAIANNSVSNADKTAPSRPGELVYQVAEKIQLQLRDGRGEIRVQLKPENLGSLEIRAGSTANGVFARIAVESGSVKNYLENNLHILQQALQDQGLKVDRLQVAVQEALSPTSGQSAQFGHAGSESQGRETQKPARFIESALVDQSEEIVIESLTPISGARSRFHTVA